MALILWQRFSICRPLDILQIITVDLHLAHRRVQHQDHTGPREQIWVGHLGTSLHPVVVAHQPAVFSVAVVHVDVGVVGCVAVALDGLSVGAVSPQTHGDQTAVGGHVVPLCFAGRCLAGRGHVRFCLAGRCRCKILVVVGIMAVVHARALVLQFMGILLPILVVVDIHIQTEARRDGILLRILRGHHPHNLVDVVPDILGHRDGLLFPQRCAVRVLPVLCFQAVPDQGLLLIVFVMGVDVELILNGLAHVLALTAQRIINLYPELFFQQLLICLLLLRRIAAEFAERHVPAPCLNLGHRGGHLVSVVLLVVFRRQIRPVDIAAHAV